MYKTSDLFGPEPIETGELLVWLPPDHDDDACTASDCSCRVRSLYAVITRAAYDESCDTVDLELTPINSGYGCSAFKTLDRLVYKNGGSNNFQKNRSYPTHWYWRRL